MGVFLRDMSIKGIKNIDKQITLVFCKKEINNIAELQNYNIKAIYGPNGSGKTAIVHAFQLLQDVLFDSDYLYKMETIKYLLELINKSCDCINLGVNFYYIDNGEILLYSYEVDLGPKGASFEILREKFVKRQNEYSKEFVIFESQLGSMLHSAFSKEINAEFINLLSKRSFSDIVYDFTIGEHAESNSNVDSDKSWDTFDIIYPLLDFVSSLVITLDAKDNHLPAIKKTLPDLDDFVVWKNKNPDPLRLISQSGYSNLEMFEDELEDFREEVKQKEKFIKLFKPNIKSIDLTERLISLGNVENRYLVNQIVNYGDYQIDLEFESVGIKKLMNLYKSIERVTNGDILVIDELDSHINDVYLIDLIEYISKYAKGQLIFTTHNISPMDILKTKKMAIDFMSSSSVITTWTQIGNYSPKKLYQNGMIKGLPFNVECEDFLEVFGHEE